MQSPQSDKMEVYIGRQKLLASNPKIYSLTKEIDSYTGNSFLRPQNSSVFSLNEFANRAPSEA